MHIATIVQLWLLLFRIDAFQWIFILNKCRKLAQWSKGLKPESINTKAQFTFQIKPVHEDIVEGIQVVMSSKDLSNCMLGGLF